MGDEYHEVIQLGDCSQGMQCNSGDIFTGAKESVLIVVDILGIFHRKFRWCNCAGSPNNLTQLLHAKLYPASTKDPRTVFTFSLLDYFLADNLECKTSVKNFVNKIKHMTNELHPSGVPVSHSDSLNHHLSVVDFDALIFF